MTYPSMAGTGQQPGHSPPDLGNRPPLVSAAAVLMLATAALGVISSGVTAITEDPIAEMGTAANMVFLALAGVVTIVFAINWSIGVGILARGVSRGRQRARVITWIVFTAGVIPILFGAGGWISEAASPIWMVFQLILFLAHGTVLGLLALPAANDWFEASSKANDPRIV